jgi:trans-AT polyketide synthase, acyltransferase and oxidoreductase domains
VDVKTIAYWTGTGAEPVFDPAGFLPLITAIRDPLHIVFDPVARAPGLAADGVISSGQPEESFASYPLLGSLPALYPEWLGDRSFQECHAVRFAYVGGDMARGISSGEMVINLARSGMLGFFGSAGVPLDRVEREIAGLKAALDPQGLSWGVNLIHQPGDPAAEQETVELFLRSGVRRMSASAFMGITPGLVRFACRGLRLDSTGRIQRRHHLFAKISRPEVARGFLEPAPPDMLGRLVASGALSSREAELARGIPLAGDITVEADSGGHTDNRPLPVLFPVVANLRQRIAAQYGYANPPRLGAAGGLGTPDAVAAAFCLGAGYVLVGTAHQACVESGLSREGKDLLFGAAMTDVAMTPSADMFELGGKVQVLKRGTMMAVRANELRRIYMRYGALGEISEETRARIERTIFRMPLERVWEETKAYFAQTDPAQIRKAAADEKYRMALVFRWYLGKSSAWAVAGQPGRSLDYQIWCGPAIGSFNAWVQGSFLESRENRRVSQVALNLMEGAAIVTRAHQLRTYGVPVPAALFSYKPVPLSAEA